MSDISSESPWLDPKFQNMWSEIIIHCDWQSIICLSRVCRYLHQTIKPTQLKLISEISVPLELPIFDHLRWIDVQAPFKHLPRQTSLEKLIIYNYDSNITYDTRSKYALKNPQDLNHLSRLHTLKIDDSQQNMYIIDYKLHKLTRLTMLSLTNFDVSSLTRLDSLSRLQNLSLKCMTYGSDLSIVCPDLPQLLDLRVGGDVRRNIDLSQLTQLTMLKWNVCQQKSITQVIGLSKLTNLLDLEIMQGVDYGKEIYYLTRLTKLVINTNFPDQINLPKLQFLEMSYVEDEKTIDLSNLTTLTKFKISYSPQPKFVLPTSLVELSIHQSCCLSREELALLTCLTLFEYDGHLHWHYALCITNTKIKKLENLFVEEVD